MTNEMMSSGVRDCECREVGEERDAESLRGLAEVTEPVLVFNE
jgi:hypothetical protein